MNGFSRAVVVGIMESEGAITMHKVFFILHFPRPRSYRTIAVGEVS
jgi:hypothetical protein